MKLNYQFEFGFACQKSICQERYSKESTTAIAIVDLDFNFCPKVMCCKSCKMIESLNYNQLLWFIPSTVLDVLKGEVCKYFVVHSFNFLKITSTYVTEIHRYSILLLICNNHMHTSYFCTKQRAELKNLWCKKWYSQGISATDKLTQNRGVYRSMSE